MSFLLNIVLLLLILGVLIFIHELGHFLAAKLTGTRVDEFAIGMGPRIFKRRFGETVYMLNLLPIGGYVSILGENDDPTQDLKKIKNDPRSFQNKNLAQKLLIMLAGVGLNLLTAVVIYQGFLFYRDFEIAVPEQIAQLGVPFGEIELQVDGPVEYLRLLEDGNLIKSGAPESGYVKSIVGGDGIRREVLITSDFGDVVKNSKGEKVLVEVCSDPELTRCEPYVSDVSEKGTVGVELVGNYMYNLKYKGVEKVFGGLLHSVNVVVLGVRNIAQVFSDASESGNYDTAVNTVSSPIGLYFLVDFVKDAGVIGVLSLIADLSLTLFVINLLPIPALDGGRVVLAIAAATLKDAYSKEVEAWLIRISFILLLIFILALFIKDILFIKQLREFFN